MVGVNHGAADIHSITQCRDIRPSGLMKERHHQSPEPRFNLKVTEEIAENNSCTFPEVGFPIMLLSMSCAFVLLH